MAVIVKKVKRDTPLDEKTKIPSFQSMAKTMPMESLCMQDSSELAIYQS